MVSKSKADKKSSRGMKGKKQTRMCQKKTKQRLSYDKQETSSLSTPDNTKEDMSGYFRIEKRESDSVEKHEDVISREEGRPSSVLESTSDENKDLSTTKDGSFRREVTDEDFVREMIMVIESEDIGFLIDTDFQIRANLLTRIPNIEALVVILSRSLGTEHRLKVIKTMRKLLEMVDLRSPSEVASNIKKYLVDYSKLLYLKGKLDFMKQRLKTKDIEPENVIEEQP